MIEKIETSAPMQTKVEFNTIIKSRKQSKAEEIINRVLYAIVGLLLLFVLATFFVKKLPDIVLDIRNLAIDAIWLMACCYTIGELIKRIFHNKGKCTKDYEDAKTEAETALNSLSENELSKRAEYCEEYALNVFKRKKALLLANARIDEETYDEKYFSLSARELKKRYGAELTKSQRKTLVRANKLKILEYNPDFLTTTADLESDVMPSEMYNARKEDKKNMITSAFFSVASSFFCVTFAGDLIFSFSLVVLFMAVVKITSVIIFSSFKATFGWNLAMRTEISRYKVQVREVGNLKQWYAKKYL